MGKSPDNAKWLSAHLFFDDFIYSAACDRILIEVVEPFVRLSEARRWIDRYFFVRFSEDGPHVRLRLHGPVEVLEDEVTPYLESFVRDHAAGSIASSSGFSRRPVQITDLRWIPYEPEWDRYGGPDGVAVAERFFYLSSEVCIALLGSLDPDDKASRFGKALLSMVVLIHTFCADRLTAAEFCEHYHKVYLRSLAPEDEGRSVWLDAFGEGYAGQADMLERYVEAAWGCLETREPLSEILDWYSAGLREIRENLKQLHASGRIVCDAVVLTEWEQIVRTIAFSYLHLMNNRLGVPWLYESYLGYLIARVLSQPAEQHAR